MTESNERFNEEYSNMAFLSITFDPSIILFWETGTVSILSWIWIYK